MPHPTINQLVTDFNGVWLNCHVERPVEGDAEHL